MDPNLCSIRIIARRELPNSWKVAAELNNQKGGVIMSSGWKVGERLLSAVELALRDAEFLLPPGTLQK